MTRQYDRERRSWRTRLHDLLRRFNALALAVLVLAMLLAPSVAQAQTTVRCRLPAVPMFYHVERRGVPITVGICRVPRYIRGVLP